MAFGVFIISIHEAVYVDIFAYMFGNILATSFEDILITGIAAVLVLSTIALLFKEFLALSFDYEMAEATGIPVRPLYYLLLILISITVVVSVKAIGIVLVAALLITPAASAYQLTHRFGRMMMLSVIFGVSSCLIGLTLSYALNIPSGATIVLVATFIFFITWLLAPRRKAFGRLLQRTPPPVSKSFSP
jgi:ABC-type Mn2+/Zn2+ transport system permease subunit